MSVNLPGDSSSKGIGTGKVEWVTLPSASMYSINNDFVYDGSSTNLFVRSGGWDGNSPRVEFRLYGAQVVPEPNSLLLTAFCGITLLGYPRRRYRNT